jgi:hypothetical protein
MATLVGRPAVLGRGVIQAGTRFPAWNTEPGWPTVWLSMAWMQCAEAVQCQQAKSLFHNVVTDLLVCQSLDVTIEIRRTSKKTA